MALILGGLSGLCGLVGVGAYVLEAVVARAGEADQSLLFWYAPLALFGLIAIALGIVAVAWGASRLRTLREST